MGIYKRKQESKKTRKQELGQDIDQENKKTRTRPRKRLRKQELDQESDQEKKEKTIDKACLVYGKNFFFLDHFLGLVFVFLYSYFLAFF